MRESGALEERRAGRGPGAGRLAGSSRRLVAPAAALLAAVALLAVLPAAAHHLGTWSPRDNAVSANFKQIKFALQAGRFDVARRLYDQGIIRRELTAAAPRLPRGLDASIRAALDVRDVATAERGLAVFFAVLIRDLALEADRRLAEPGETPEARAADARRFLEAIWRYWNLVDFTVTSHDARAAAAVRLAIDEAQGYAGGAPAPAAANPCAGTRPPGPATDPGRLRPPLRRVADVLTGVIEAFPTRVRRDP